MSSSNSPLRLTNGALTFAPDFTGLQTYSAAVPSTWAPVTGGAILELPQIGLWIGEPGLGPANAIGQIGNANQSLTPQTGVLTSNFSSDNCLWAVTTVVNPDEPEIAFRVERASLNSSDDSHSASYSADTPPLAGARGASGGARDLLLDSYTADTPKLPDQFVNPSQPTAAQYETTHQDVHAGYAPGAQGLPDGALWGSPDDAALNNAGRDHGAESDGAAAGAPEFGIFLAAREDAGSMSVSQPPGSHRLTGADTYVVSQRDADHAFEYSAALTVNNGVAQDLGLNEIAIYAKGSVLDVVIRFAPGDDASEASANTAAVAADAAARWGRHLSAPHAPDVH